MADPSSTRRTIRCPALVTSTSPATISCRTRSSIGSPGGYPPRLRRWARGTDGQDVAVAGHNPLPRLDRSGLPPRYPSGPRTPGRAMESMDARGPLWSLEGRAGGEEGPARSRHDPHLSGGRIAHTVRHSSFETRSTYALLGGGGRVDRANPPIGWRYRDTPRGRRRGFMDRRTRQPSIATILTTSSWLSETSTFYRPGHRSNGNSALRAGHDRRPHRSRDLREEHPLATG